MPVTEQDLLNEIQRIVGFGPSYNSREKARNFYDSLDLPVMLKGYIVNRNESRSRSSKALGLNPGTLSRLLSEKSITENMLFRLRNALDQLNGGGQPGLGAKQGEQSFPGDWRNTNATEIQVAISEVTSRLIFLKNVVARSNSLKAPDSPIDSIQVAQLIAMLEAALSALKAPFVDRNQTRGFFGYLKKLGKRVVEKKVENVLSNAIDQAVDAGVDLVDKLGDASGTPDIGGLIT